MKKKNELRELKKINFFFFKVMSLLMVLRRRKMCLNLLKKEEEKKRLLLGMEGELLKKGLFLKIIEQSKRRRLVCSN